MLLWDILQKFVARSSASWAVVLGHQRLVPLALHWTRVVPLLLRLQRTFDYSKETRPWESVRAGLYYKLRGYQGGAITKMDFISLTPTGGGGGGGFGPCSLNVNAGKMGTTEAMTYRTLMPQSLAIGSHCRQLSREGASSVCMLRREQLTGCLLALLLQQYRERRSRDGPLTVRGHQVQHGTTKRAPSGSRSTDAQLECMPEPQGASFSAGIGDSFYGQACFGPSTEGVPSTCTATGSWPCESGTMTGPSILNATRPFVRRTVKITYVVLP